MDLTDAEVAVTAVVAGAEVVARTYGHEHRRAAKSSVDFATDTDVEAERVILDVLAQHRPGDGRTGEETGQAGDAGAGRRWLVDPLCGTLNFAATTPLVAVNVALSVDGEARIGATADPLSGEVFWTDGVSSHVTRAGAVHPLTPTAVSKLVDVNCDGPLDAPFVGGQLVADPRLRGVFGPRVISSTLAVAWVAAGRRAAYVSDGQFRDNLHFAAGIAVCRAAGCIVSDLSGDPLHTGRGLVVSADRETHDTMLALIGPHLEESLSG